MQLMKDSGSRSSTLGMLLCGICTSAGGIVTALLQERYGLSYVWSGTFLSCLSAGQLAASLLVGFLAQWWHLRGAVLTLVTGAMLGYGLMLFTSNPVLLALGFALVGVAKGATLNVSSVMIGRSAYPGAKGLNLIHACFALGSLLSPVLIGLATGPSQRGPYVLLSMCGLLLIVSYAFAHLPGKESGARKSAGTWDFLRQRTFWLLAGLLFFETCSEGGVTSWLVSYYRGAGILTGEASSYTLTVIWGMMLLMRLTIAFLLPPMRESRMMVVISAVCIAAYAGLMAVRTPATSLAMLAVFGLCVAGANPTVVAGAGKMTSAQSMSVLLPIGALGSILMPLLIGLIADRVSLRAGMASILVTLGLMLLFSLLWVREERSPRGAAPGPRLRAKGP